MALTFTERAETGSTTDGTSFTSASYTPLASRGLVALVYASGTIAAVPTGAGNGVTWTLVGQNTRGANCLYAFVALTGASPTTTGFTFSCPTDAATGALIHVLEIAGCDLTDFIGRVEDADETAAGAAVSSVFPSAIAASSGVVAFAGGQSNPLNIVPPSGFTELMDAGYSNPASGAETAVHASPGAITTVTWGSTVAIQTAQILLEILDAAGVSSITTSTVNATTSVPTPSISAGITTTTSTVNAVATVATPLVVTSTTVTNTTVNAVTTVATPLVAATSGGGSVTVIRGDVQATASVPTPAVTGTSLVTTATVTTTTIVPFPAVAVHAPVTVSTVSLTVEVPLAVVTAGALVVPPLFAPTAQVEIPASPTPEIATEVELTTVTVTVTIPAPTSPVNNVPRPSAVAAANDRYGTKYGFVTRGRRVPGLREP